MALYNRLFPFATSVRMCSSYLSLWCRKFDPSIEGIMEKIVHSQIIVITVSDNPAPDPGTG